MLQLFAKSSETLALPQWFFHGHGWFLPRYTLLTCHDSSLLLMFDMCFSAAVQGIALSLSFMLDSTSFNKSSRSFMVNPQQATHKKNCTAARIMWQPLREDVKPLANKPLDHDNLSVTECHGLFKHVHMGICGDTW